MTPNVRLVPSPTVNETPSQFETEFQKRGGGGMELLSWEAILVIAILLLLALVLAMVREKRKKDDDDKPR